jgi:aromatic-L-amino-acid decarboxylase
VVANLGTTNTGSVDDLEALAVICARFSLWLHGDGAYGGLFAMTPTGASRLRGLALCDSLTVDPHKTLFLPYGTGCLLVKRTETLLRAFNAHGEYLRDVIGTREPEPSFLDISPEMSRDFRGLRVWLPLRLHGAAVFRQQLEEKLALTAQACARLRTDSRFEIACEPTLSVIAFRLRVDDRSPASQDELNTALLHGVNARGPVYLSSTTLRERVFLRLCILSYRTHVDGVRVALRIIRDVATILVGPAEIHSRL